jgi:hypothetical protein
MDYQERSSVWKTRRFLATSCRIIKASGLEYILTRKCPLPFQGADCLTTVTENPLNFQMRLPWAVVALDKRSRLCNACLGTPLWAR